MDGWIRASDRLPELGRLVDVWCGDRGRRADCLCYHVDPRGVGLWNDRWGNYVGRGTVTHWREIPGPPSDDEPGA